MKRVCTLRKVLRSLSKVLLEKLFLSFLYIVAFYRHSVLIVFIISPAGRYAMEWKGNPKYLHEKKWFFSNFSTKPHILYEGAIFLRKFNIKN